MNETAGGESHFVRRVSAVVDDSNLREEEWWKTNQDKISVLMKLCARAYDWDDATSKKVLNAYRQFLVIKREHSDWDSKKFTPCWSVNQMWKQHSTLDDYDFDMSNLCGHVLHRVCSNRASELPRDEKWRSYQATLELVKSRFEASFDSELWSDIRVSFYDQIGDGEVYDINTFEPMSDYFETFAQSKDDDVKNYYFMSGRHEIALHFRNQ